VEPQLFAKVLVEAALPQPGPQRDDTSGRSHYTFAMRYIMRERILSWGDDFTIKDADGRNTYYIDGKVFSFGDKLSFRDMEGNELARIDQKLLSLGPQYEIIRGGATVAVVKKHLFTLFRARFTVDVPGPDDLEAQGNFLAHEYAFERDGREVARASKKWVSLSDTYAIDIDEGEDAVIILASAVVIDLVSHPDEKKD
jgi:uncharacterized protein YxjI